MNRCLFIYIYIYVYIYVYFSIIFPFYLVLCEGGLSGLFSSCFYIIEKSPCIQRLHSFPKQLNGDSIELFKYCKLWR